MILRIGIGAFFAWAFAGLVYLVWTASPNAEAATMLQYAFYAMTALAIFVTGYFLYMSHMTYALTGDSQALIVLRVFQVAAYLLLIGTLLAIAFAPWRFFPQSAPRGATVTVPNEVRK